MSDDQTAALERWEELLSRYVDLATVELRRVPGTGQHDGDPPGLDDLEAAQWEQAQALRRYLELRRGRSAPHPRGHRRH
jgi:hypothetical protein